LKRNQTYKRIHNPYFWNQQNQKCNCGSFALDVSTWFTPYDNNDDYLEEDRTAIIRSLYQEGFSRKEIMEAIIQRDQEEILEACPWIEPILYDEISLEDRIVAYRIGIQFDDWHEIDEDFHFRVRIGGFWFEKCGEDDIRLCADQNVTNVWYTDENLFYDSDIVYFRFKDKI
jgi:hypothetical protein